MTTVVQQCIIQYLTEKGHKLRHQCLSDIIERGAFEDPGNRMSDSATNLRTRSIIRTYLAENPRGFCDDGIRRFREFAGVTDNKRKVRLVLDVEVDFESENKLRRFGEGGNDGGVTFGVFNLLKDATIKGVGQISQVQWVDYSTDCEKVDFAYHYKQILK